METDATPVFLVLYLPKSDPREYELALDAACAALLKPTMSEGGELLADRQAVGGGPPNGASSAWDELEL